MSFVFQKSRKPFAVAPLQILILLLVVSLCFTQACGTNEPTEQTQETTVEVAQEASKEQTIEKVEKTPEEPTDTPDEPGVEKPVSDAGKESTTPDQSEPIAEAKPEETVEPTPEKPAENPWVAAVVNSNFVKGSLSLLRLKDRKLVKEWTQFDKAGDISGDVALKVADNKVFVINRGTGDIQVLDMKNQFKKIATIAVGPKTNPHDLVVVGSKLCVTLYDQSAVNVYENNKLSTSIDLDSLAETSTKKCTKDDDCTKFGAGSKKCNTGTGVCESDNIPELDFMFLVGTKLYIGVQGLDRNDGYKPTKSYLAVIDTATNKLTEQLDLKGSNPVGAYKEPSGTYLIAETGSALDATDGGVERFDPKTGKMSGSYLITEKELGGNLGSIVVVSKTVAYAVVSDASYKQSLVQWDPSTGKKTKDLLTGKSLGSLALSNKGELLLSDKGEKGKNFGLRVFEASTGKELTTAPIATSATLPPTLIRLFETAQGNLP